MNEVIYEFTGDTPGRPRRKWLTAVWLGLLVAAATWGLVVLGRMRSEAQVKECFELRTDVHENVIAVFARVPQVPEDVLKLLSRYPQLRKVDLSGTTTVGGGLRSLVLIDGLRVLDLRGCAWVDDDEVQRLAALNDLRRLDLSGTQITDAGLRSIMSLPRLRVLMIEGCKGVTDRGLEICAGMTQLGQLWPGGAGYTIDGLFALRERRRDLNLQLQACDVVGRPRRRVDWIAEDYFTSKEVALRMGNLYRPVSPSDPAVQFHSDAMMHGVYPNPVAIQGVTMSLSTDADIEALRQLLRFPQDWRNSRCEDRFLFETLGKVPAENYEEHVEEDWTFLQLRGPAAGWSLAKVLPLTPRLFELRLEETTIATDEFLFELVPPGLRRLTISVPGSEFESLSASLSMADLSAEAERLQRDGAAYKSSAISASFLGRLIQHTSLEYLSLNDVRIDGIEPATQTDAPADVFPVELLLPGLRNLSIRNTAVSPAFLRILSEHASLKELHLTDVDADGVDPGELATEDATTVQYMDVHEFGVRFLGDESDEGYEIGITVEMRGPVAGQSLANVLALTPQLIRLNLQEMTIATGQFPFDQLSPRLGSLTIANTAVSESFLRELSQHSALEDLSLTNVAIDGHDVLAETTIRADDAPGDQWFPKLQSLSIESMPVSESFLGELSQHSALGGLSLRDVALEGVDATDPALGHFHSLQWMNLVNVKVNGVALTDPALKPLMLRLREQLPQVNLDVYTISEDGEYLHWHDLGE